jgi:hypothetical protein
MVELSNNIIGIISGIIGIMSGFLSIISFRTGSKIKSSKSDLGKWVYIFIFILASILFILSLVFIIVALMIYFDVYLIEIRNVYN